MFADDLDSRNETFVGGQRIQEQPIETGEASRGYARVVLSAARRRRDEAQSAEHSLHEDGFVIRNPKMKRLYEHALRAAKVNVPALILGETGAGKEHLARTLHERGPRRDGPFVAINCAAIPNGLVETALFGHERGAFTGATDRGAGIFERAHRGVLFLDEVGELSSSAQAALLRALETQRICRVGAASEISVDIRVVAATHCDLQSKITHGSFRQDLYFRLSGIVLRVPPLRERLDELKPLVDLFLSNACPDWNRSRRNLTPEAIDALSRYAWPGNVRQLRQAVEHAALLGLGAEVGVADLPEYVLESAKAVEQCLRFSTGFVELSLEQQLLRFERSLIEEALRRTGGNREIAAQLLRIPVRTFYRRLRACGIGASEPRRLHPRAFSQPEDGSRSSVWEPPSCR